MPGSRTGDTGGDGVAPYNYTEEPGARERLQRGTPAFSWEKVASVRAKTTTGAALTPQGNDSLGIS
jgi:hypothetical protein